MATTYPAVYRARAVKYEPPVVTALVPQVFGQTAIEIIDSIGTPAPGMGWVFFQGGNPEFPVWTSGTGGSGVGGGGTVSDVMWVGPSQPSTGLELWYDTDEPGANLFWNTAWGVVTKGSMVTSPVTLTANTFVSVTNPLPFTTLAGRRYRIVLSVRALRSSVSASSFARLSLRDGVTHLYPTAQALAWSPGTGTLGYNLIHYAWVVDGDDVLRSWNVGISSDTTASDAYVEPTLSFFYIEDIGPITRLPSGVPPESPDWTPYDARYATRGYVDALATPSTWTALPLAGTWATYDSGVNWQVPQYRMIGDIVYVRGMVKKATGGTAGTTDTIATLPAGFRPPRSIIFVVWVSYNGAVVRGPFRLSINYSSGALEFAYPSGFANIAATGITFPTATSIDHINFDGIQFSVTT